MGRVADQPGLLLRPRGAVDIAADFAPLWIAYDLVRDKASGA